MKNKLAKELKTVLKEDFDIDISLEQANYLGDVWVDYLELLISAFKT